jgi:RNA polymerase sigma-70 factor (ECF subfamily)
LRDGARAPDGALLEDELRRVTRAALAMLDEDKRLVFVLRVYRQYSYDEIAAITGFSVAKIRNDLHRARAEMRRRLSSYLGVEREL